MSADRLNALVGLSFAMPLESPASWLTRATLRQGTTVLRMVRYLGWMSRDLDQWFADFYADGVPSNVPELRRLQVAHRVMQGFKASGLASERLLLFDGRKSRYRYCPRCLATDPSPYFRIHWRFACWLYCPDHACLMRDTCPECHGFVRLPVSLLNAGPKGKGIAELSECAVCGHALSEARAIPIGPSLDHDSPQEQMRYANGRAVLAALYHGGFRLSPTGANLPLERLRMIDREGLIPSRVAEE